MCKAHFSLCVYAARERKVSLRIYYILICERKLHLNLNTEETQVDAVTQFFILLLSLSLFLMPYYSWKMYAVSFYETYISINKCIYLFTHVPLSAELGDNRIKITRNATRCRIQWRRMRLSGCTGTQQRAFFRQKYRRHHRRRGRPS